MPITAKFDADFSDFIAETAKADKALTELGTASQKTQTFTKGLHGSLSQFDRVLSSVGINMGSTVSAVGELANAVGKTTSELGLFTTAGLAAGAAMAGWQIGTMIGNIGMVSDAIKKVGEQIMFTGAALDKETIGAKQDVINKAIKDGAAATISYSDAIKYNNEVARQHGLILETNERRVAGWEKQIEKIVTAGNWQQFTADLASQNFTMKELSQRYNISAEALDYYNRTQKEATEDAKAQQKAVDDLFKTWEEGEKIMQDFAIKTHGIAMEEMRKEREERAKMLADRNQQVVDGLEQIKGIQADYTDAILKSALSETDYKIAKIHEWQDAQIAAFKGTEQQLDQFTNAVKLRAEQQIADLTRVAATVGTVGDEYSEMYKQATTGVLVIGQGTADLATQQQQAAKVTGDVVSEEYRRQQEAFMGFKGVVVAGTGEMTAASQNLTNVMQAGYDTVMRDWAIRQAQLARGEFFMLGMSSTTPVAPQTRQGGGPVSAGHTYLVGESGPELFRPSSAGMIVPNGGGVTVHNTFYVNGSIRDLALPLMDELSRMMKQTRQWPSAT